MNCLARWLKQNGIKQVELARLLRCSEPTVSLILKGERLPSRSLARRISKTTGLSLETVMFDEAR
jgi:transcriptional regulator with XRE-family HTH domain